MNLEDLTKMYYENEEGINFDDEEGKKILEKRSISLPSIDKNMKINVPSIDENLANQLQDEKQKKKNDSKGIRYNRIFKKTSQDGNLILFLPQREIMIIESGLEPLMGVALAHKSILKEDIKVYIHVVLIFRYGREDEELMGLRFCNEIVLSADQIFPSSPSFTLDNLQSKANAQGYIAIPFALDMGTAAPPSIRLHPCRPYNGASIGTLYEVQLFAGKHPEDLPRKRKMVQMAVRLYERLPLEIPLRSILSMEKKFLFSDSRLYVQAKLDSGIYSEGDTINLSINIERPRGHGVKKLCIYVVQQVSVTMFSTGNFKNYVGEATEKMNCRESCFKSNIPVKIQLGNDYSWVAMDETMKRDELTKQLAPSVVHTNKSMFVIKVNYYVLVVLKFGLFHKNISLKLPFLLKRITDDLNANK